MKKIAIIALLTLFATSAFAAKPTDAYKFTYLDMLSIQLNSEYGEDDYPGVSRVEFEKKAPKTINIEIDVAENETATNKKKMSDFYKGVAEQAAADLGVKGVIFNMKVGSEDLD